MHILGKLWLEYFQLGWGECLLKYTLCQNLTLLLKKKNCWVEKKYEIMPGKVIALQDICSIKDAFFKEVILEK